MALLIVSANTRKYRPLISAQFDRKDSFIVKKTRSNTGRLKLVVFFASIEFTDSSTHKKNHTLIYLYGNYPKIKL